MTNTPNNIHSNNTTLNLSYQDSGYKKQNTYFKSPSKYNRQTNSFYGNNEFNTPNSRINNYKNNNPYERIDNNLSGINNVSNINNYSNISNLNNTISSYSSSSNYSNYSYNTYSNYNNYSNSESNFSINLEDLMILEEKLSEIINASQMNNPMNNECFEWWNYYYNCSLLRKIEKVFKGDDSAMVISSIKYELFSIMLCYDISYDIELLKKVIIMINAILHLNHKNLLIICEYILSKISNESLSNTWVFKLKNLVASSKRKTEENNYIVFNGYSLTTIDKIKFNTNTISNDLKIILKNYPITKQKDNLINLYRTLHEKNYDEINRFFRENIMRVENPNASVLGSVALRQNSNFSSVKPPYLKTKNLKNYTLVLDLDETIIHFKINPNNESEGVLKLRPGIFEFLETLGKYYEIVIFTAATQEYADLILDRIEEKTIYFDYKLYRQHAVIIDNDFIKDLNRLGRPLDKVIIVDNMPQNFRLQKENGINIRAYWGEDPNDTALYSLKDILINIANEGGDVRKSLAKYKDEIVRKVTTNISKHND